MDRRELKAERAKARKCLECGTPLATGEVRQRCRTCRLASNRQVFKTRVKRLREGLCQYCGKRLVNELRGHGLGCDACLDKYRERSRVIRSNK